jgi:hypothetical protein
MASVRKRGQRWTGLYRDADGKQKSAGTFGTENAAIKAAEAREAIVKAGETPRYWTSRRRSTRYRNAAFRRGFDGDLESLFAQVDTQFSHAQQAAAVPKLPRSFCHAGYVPILSMRTSGRKVNRGHLGRAGHWWWEIACVLGRCGCCHYW